MEVDLALLEEVEAATLPMTRVRVYRWDRPTVSLGRHQTAEKAADLSYCGEKGIPVVWRPTGGRAVFHGDELTYAVISNDASTFPVGDVTASYRVIAAVLAGALRDLGIDVELASGKGATRPLKRGCSQPPCFLSASRFELVHQGRKLAGSAQRRLRRSFLQHGSMPLRLDYTAMAGALRAEESSLRLSLVSVSEAAGREVGFEALAEALHRSFEAAFRSAGRFKASRQLQGRSVCFRGEEYAI